jgi:hypothetical protein
VKVILAHGYLGFRSFLGMQYFNGVQAYLQARPARSTTARSPSLPPNGGTSIPTPGWETTPS